MKIQAKTSNVASLLLVENERYVIPPYQRRYSWESVHVNELLRDVELLDGGETHLLGSIVCLMGAHTAGINDLELVDGQQRITTIMIVLLCIAERLAENDPSYNPASINALLQSTAYGVEPKPKLALDSLDAAEFDALSRQKTVLKPRNPRLAAAFATVREWTREKSTQGLYEFLHKLKNASMMIRLEVSEAKDAFKLFETINNRGLSLSPTDIIKNFVLGNAAGFGKQSLDIARQRWAELIDCLDGTSLDAFFRHYLCAKLKRRITVSFVIANFKTAFVSQVNEASSVPDPGSAGKARSASDDPADSAQSSNGAVATKVQLPKLSFVEFLDDLVKSAKTYGEIVRCETNHASADTHLENLRRINALQTYGFLMALRLGGCDDKTFVAALKLTESFLMRRHTCGERANENEALFARLCSIDARSPLGELREEYRKLTPSDEKFRASFAEEHFTANLIDRARYCLEQFEYRALGEHAELSVNGPDAVHVEHIIPQKIKSKKSVAMNGDWVTYLGAGSSDAHPQYVGRIGNLTLLAGALNTSASNGPYDKKRAFYAKSSLATTKSIAESYPEFRYAEVTARCEAMADEAVLLWPIP